MIPNEKKLSRILAVEGTHTLDDLLALVRSGHMRLFVENDSVLFTQVVDFPRMRVVEFFLVVGTLADLPELERQASEYAVSIGAKRIRAFARRGWSRASVRHSAWKAVRTVWQKDL